MPWSLVEACNQRHCNNKMADADDWVTKLQQASVTGTLHLAHAGLTQVPPEVFKLTGLVRLDLAWNDLEALPADIGKLTKLEQLWLNSNPLGALPKELELCRRLKVLDLRDTQLRTLPPELSRAPNVVEIDLRGAELEPVAQEAFAAGGTLGLLTHLRAEDLKNTLEKALEGRLAEGVYREVADTERGQAQIKALVQEVFTEFTEMDDVKNLVRNAERLFPPDIGAASAPKIRRVFMKLRRQNEMKKLAAELELKMRAIYFDRIDPSCVEGIVKSIYAEIHTLGDIQFLIQHARELFPPEASDVDAAVLRQDLKGLQDRLARERAAAIAGLAKALRSVYSHLEPKLIGQLADAVAEFFRKVEEIKKLAADAGMLFPAEFETAMENPKAIRIAFKRNNTLNATGKAS